MCVAIFIVHDNVHQDFKPQQAVQGALLLTAAASTITIVFLIRVSSVTVALSGQTDPASAVNRGMGSL